MKASPAAVDLIVKFEGRRLRAYRDATGVPAIGYGTTIYPSGDPVAFDDRISPAEARSCLVLACASVADAVTAALGPVVVTQNQFDALVSFVFGVGSSSFRSSALLAALRSGDAARAASEFARWNRSTVNGSRVVLPGLVARRAAEQALFTKPPPRGGVTSLRSSIRYTIPAATATAR